MTTTFEEAEMTAMLSEARALDYAGLRTRIAGDVVLPGDSNWDEARQAWNLAADQRPAAVAIPESADDVKAIVDFARESGLRIAPQGTGHNSLPLRELEQTILVKTHRMRAVAIDADSERAWVQAGVLWMEVTAAAAEHGLAALAGSSPDVGVVGYSLGGGISWLARKHGLAANNITAIELVTADGELVRADAEHNADLFWALRGGGGSFGIVTALEFRLFPLAEVYGGVLFFPVERASIVLQAWREWVETVPDDVTSVGRILNFPPIPDIPEPMRGNSFVVVEAVSLLGAAATDALLAPLRALGPAMDTFGAIPVEKLHHLHMDPEHPVPGTGDGMMLSELTPEAVDAFVGVTGSGNDTLLLSAEIRHAGGALARRDPRNGALASIDAAFVVFAVGMAITPEMKAAVEARVDEVKEALAPWDSGSDYLNFSERPRDGRRFYRAETYHRLRAIKTQRDPGHLFRSNHPIPPATPRPVRPRLRRIGRPAPRTAARA
jgi:FAD/FMN-containing dehydrogenase